MSEYPLMHHIDSKDWDENVEVGVEHMQASDGTYKTHILHSTLVYSFSFVHRYISVSESRGVMDFWANNYMREFPFTSPLDDRQAIVRFKRRPKLIEKEGPWVSVRVELIGRYV